MRYIISEMAAGLKVPLLIGVFLLAITQLLVFRPAVGAIFVGIVILFLITLLNPRYAYFIFLAFLPAEGFEAIPGVTHVKIVGILLSLGIALRVLMKKESFPKDNLIIYFLAFFIGGLASLFFAADIGVSIKIYITYVSLFVFYMLSRYFIRNLKDIEISLNVLIISNLIMVAGVYFLIYGETVSPTERLSGGMGDPNEYASFVLVLLPMTIYLAFKNRGLKKVLYWACCGFLFLLTVFSFSRGGVLGLLGLSITLIFYYGRTKIKQLVIMFALIGMISVLLVPDDFWQRSSTIINPEKEKTIYRGESIEARLANYQAAIRMFGDNPVAGVGIYNYQFGSAKYGGFPNLVVHNTYLEILSGEGLAGFIPFLLILVISWKNLRVRAIDSERLRNLMICLKASFVSVLITSSFISADHKKILWFLLAVISSIYAVARAHREFRETARVQIQREQGL
jgi:O-antigen ligase